MRSPHLRQSYQKSWDAFLEATMKLWCFLEQSIGRIGNEPKTRTSLAQEGYFLRWRIRERMRRFFWPSFRRPLPVFFTPTNDSPNRLRYCFRLLLLSDST